jgi:hypothetical protein
MWKTSKIMLRWFQNGKEEKQENEEQEDERQDVPLRFRQAIQQVLWGINQEVL